MTCQACRQSTSATPAVRLNLEDIDVPGLRVNLSREKASSPGAGSMLLAHIEDVEGTAYADVIRGSRARNVLRGLGGDDRIYGRGGRDRADGGSGHDTCVAEVRVSC